MRNWLKVAIADVILVSALYLVVQDVQWRASYAASKGLAATYEYSFFSQVFRMSQNTLLLQSPMTLDWLQVLAVLLIAVNLWYVLVFARSRRNRLVQTT